MENVSNKILYLLIHTYIFFVDKFPSLHIGRLPSFSQLGTEISFRPSKMVFVVKASSLNQGIKEMRTEDRTIMLRIFKCWKVAHSMMGELILRDCVGKSLWE